MKTIKFEEFDVNGQRIDDLEMDVDDAFEQIKKLQDDNAILKERVDNLYAVYDILFNLINIDAVSKETR